MKRNTKLKCNPNCPKCKKRLEEERNKEAEEHAEFYNQIFIG